MRYQNNNHGFTLTEVLLALGIFTVGFSMMAMALPIAALMQKNTADSIYSKIVAGQSKAIIKAAQLKLGNRLSDQNVPLLGLDTRFPLLGDPTDITDPAHLVLFPFPDDTRDETALFQMALETNDEDTFGMLTRPETRSYPIGDLSPRIYWVPLVRRILLNPDSGLSSWSDVSHTWRTKQSEWQFVVAILKYRSQARYDRTNGLWAYQTSDPAGDPTVIDADPSNDNDPWQGSSRVPGLIRVDCNIADSDIFVFDNDYNGDNQPDVKFGHMLIDEFGGIYRVAGPDPQNPDDIDRVQVVGGIPTTPTKLWYAPGTVDGGDSPILDVILLTSNSTNQLTIDNKVF